MSQRKTQHNRLRFYVLLVLVGLARCAPGASYAQSAGEEVADVRPPNMIRIPQRTFMMGSPLTDEKSFAYRPAEKPVHEVTVGGFLIGRFLVTAEEFARFLNDAGNQGYFIEDTGWIDWRTIKKVDDRFVPQDAAERCPAFPITWFGAVAYCEWLSQKLGRTFRLPTQAEWEAAARGSEGRVWPWGDETPIRCGPRGPLKPGFLIKALDDEGILEPYPPYRDVEADEYMPFYDLRGLRWMYKPWDEQRPWMKAPVGSFPLNATPEGVYDMVGYHAGQWCSDYYVESYEQLSLEKGTRVSNGDALRVVRGGYQVRVDYSFRRRPLLSIRWLLPGDAKWPSYTPGRVWSRKGLAPTEGTMFRLAESPCAVGQDKADDGGQRKPIIVAP